MFSAPSEELAAEIAENCDNDELSEDLALDQTQITLLVTVLKKMLKMDPRERATTEELLRDPWFANIT